MNCKRQVKPFCPNSVHHLSLLTFALVQRCTVFLGALIYSFTLEYIKSYRCIYVIELIDCLNENWIASSGNVNKMQLSIFVREDNYFLFFLTSTFSSFNRVLHLAHVLETFGGRNENPGELSFLETTRMEMI